MSEGETCNVSCFGNMTRVGYITCSNGMHVGSSTCQPQHSVVAIVGVEKLAATITVVIDFWNVVNLALLIDFLKGGLSAALGVPVDNVQKLDVLEIGLGSAGALRRLNSPQRKHYDVSYEILLPSESGADFILGKANSLTTPSSMESQVLQQELQAQPTIKEVYRVLPKVAARKFQDEMAVYQTDAAPEDSENYQPSGAWITPERAPIVALAFVLLLAIVVGASLYMPRLLGKWTNLKLCKAFSNKVSTTKDLGAVCTSVMPEEPPHTLLGKQGFGQCQKGSSNLSIAWGEDAAISRPVRPHPEYTSGSDLERVESF